MENATGNASFLIDISEFGYELLEVQKGLAVLMLVSLASGLAVKSPVFGVYFIISSDTTLGFKTFIDLKNQSNLISSPSKFSLSRADMLDFYFALFGLLNPTPGYCLPPLCEAGDQSSDLLYISCPV